MSCNAYMKYWCKTVNMVTTMTPTTTTITGQAQPVNMVMHSVSPTSDSASHELHVVTEKGTTAADTSKTDVPQIQKWSRITSKPLQPAPVPEQHPDTVTKQGLSKETIDQQNKASADVSTHEHTYYDVLNPEGDELFSLCHSDIMSCRCKVNLERLTKTDILDIQKALNPKKPDDKPEEEDLHVGLKSSKPKRLSHRPMKRPARERLKAQQLITEHNRKIRSHEINVKPILPPQSVPPPTVEPVTDKQESAQTPNIMKVMTEVMTVMIL